MQREHAHVARHITTQQCHLAIRGERKRQRCFTRQPDFRPEAVRVNDGMNRRGEQNRQHLKRLREFEPQKRHHQNDGVIKEPQKRQSSVTQNDKEGAKQVEEA